MFPCCYTSAEEFLHCVDAIIIIIRIRMEVLPYSATPAPGVK